MYDKSNITKLKCKLNEDTMPKKQKSPEEDEIKSKTSQQQQREPTLTHDHAASRLVKTKYHPKHHHLEWRTVVLEESTAIRRDTNIMVQFPDEFLPSLSQPWQYKHKR